MAIFMEIGGALRHRLDDLADADALAALRGYERLHVVGPDLKGGLYHVAAEDRWRHKGQDVAAPDTLRDGKARRWLVPGGKSNPHPQGGKATWQRG